MCAGGLGMESGVKLALRRGSVRDFYLFIGQDHHYNKTYNICQIGSCEKQRFDVLCKGNR
ncbi:hypothetical protein CDQ84_09915 [Clostridium thermosuccinogenes]|uniref:Uncharacterized protein n=1 Tax=Clostridium thermosuccinogenes TaxID=84032 RepID=A0A2K2F126_9CLOT|nr:hypothetical protein CDO33_10665 [Pseudoclostridium thermosuccinogenes]PNT92473.1 hypothetical protein CDQ83_02575 [Pseudoclostridium thermosuccinogenes]PNT96989.1 hypothetical protein CDQ85_09765 [Pseudoclostridium thermosuccinogenes]PNT98848.1 hypothetical protein CDQ84_09915 [Pseudoclostridium thermosuccinogenes]